MRFGQLRGVILAALLAVLAISQTASADGFHNTIPREVLAQDLNTGQPFFAPPVPWGHYAKDGLFDQFYPKAGHLSFLHHGCKNCGGSGLGLGGHGCKNCGGSGCGLGSKCGLGAKCGRGQFGHGGTMSGNGCGDPGCGSSHGSARRINDCGLCKNKGCGLCQSSNVGDPMYVTNSGQGSSPQLVTPVGSSRIVDPGSGFVGGQTTLCDGCAGKGCGKCGFGGLLRKGNGDACGGCGMKGCGGKCGLFGKSGGCGACGGKGCGKCGLFGNGGCGNCGGRGCGMCGLGGNVKGKLAGLLHHKQGKIKYFVGPGGPVPLTPGYVPYTVTTRSPRDFLAFPPYTPSEY